MGAGDVGAFDRVAKQGASALPALVDAIAKRQGGYGAAAALAWLELDDRVATLASLMRHASDAVQSAAVRALGIVPDRDALAPLVAALDDDSQPLIAVRSVGDLGIADGIEPIRRTLRRRLGHDPADSAARAEAVKLAIDDACSGGLIELAVGAEALAKLGDFSLCEATVELATFDPGLDIGFDDAGMVRLYATRALDVMVGPGIVAALDAASRDSDREVVAAATRAMLHLGRTRAAARWLELAGRSDYLAATARECRERLVDKPMVPADDAATWWMEHAAKLAPDTCYLFGEPATPAALVERARKNGSSGDRIELAQMTGCAFLAPELEDPPACVIAALDAWWASNAGRFPPGQLHRWGRTYAPDAVR